jgi:hypothetical protein
MHRRQNNRHAPQARCSTFSASREALEVY